MMSNSRSVRRTAWLRPFGEITAPDMIVSGRKAVIHRSSSGLESRKTTVTTEFPNTVDERSDGVVPNPAETEFRRGWPAVLACFRGCCWQSPGFRERSGTMRRPRRS